MIASIMSTKITDDLLFRVDREIKICLSIIDKVQVFITTQSSASSEKRPKPL